LAKKEENAEETPTLLEEKPQTAKKPESEKRNTRRGFHGTFKRERLRTQGFKREKNQTIKRRGGSKAPDPIRKAHLRRGDS